MYQNYVNKIKKCFLFCIMMLCNCGYTDSFLVYRDPVNIVIKNINLIPNMIEDTNRIPDLTPTSLNKEKTENISKQIKMPSINAPKPAEDVIKIKDKMKNFLNNNSFSQVNFNYIFSPQIMPDAKGIDTMFNLSNIGLDKVFKSEKGNDISFEFLGDMAKKNPISINLAPMPNMPKKLPFPGGISKNVPSISNPVTDIQIPGIEDPMPSKITNPLTKKDYDFDPNLQVLTDFITPDDTMNSNVLDILP